MGQSELNLSWWLREHIGENSGELDLQRAVMEGYRLDGTGGFMRQGLGFTLLDSRPRAREVVKALDKSEPGLHPSLIALTQDIRPPIEAVARTKVTDVDIICEDGDRFPDLSGVLGSKWQGQGASSTGVRTLRREGKDSTVCIVRKEIPFGWRAKELACNYDLAVASLTVRDNLLIAQTDQGFWGPIGDCSVRIDGWRELVRPENHELALMVVTRAVRISELWLAPDNKKLPLAVDSNEQLVFYFDVLQEIEQKRRNWEKASGAVKYGAREIAAVREYFMVWRSDQVPGGLGLKLVRAAEVTRNSSLKEVNQLKQDILRFGSSALMYF